MTWLTLCLLLIPNLLWACTFTWNAPTTNTDGSPLTDLAGYTLYQSDSSGVQTITVDAPATTVVMPGACRVGQYWVTARNVAGIESDPSNIVVFKKPNVPVNFDGRKS